MMNFDNASREFCSVNSSRTNTPLQALNLLNDPTFVEAARALAQRMIRHGGDTHREAIQMGYRALLGRSASSRVLGILEDGYQDYLSVFQQRPEAAQQLNGTGSTDPDAAIDPCQLAALTLVASTILNLDETVTKE